mmetsp:Transcript_129603/g.415597  ORF Transcript_129603/g.415597 Transcript_129603/m.415597 type:complete len:1058 (-) Transcript_129603:62-3235(-)
MERCCTPLVVVRSFAVLGAVSAAPLVGGRGASLAEDGAARIYTYRLPDCSFDDFPPDAIDSPSGFFPPLLPIHRRIVHGRYSTTDPANATLFYIPVPFFFWDNSDVVSSVYGSGQDQGRRCLRAQVQHVAGPALVRGGDEGASMLALPWAALGALPSLTLSLWYRGAGTPSSSSTSAVGRTALTSIDAGRGREVLFVGISDGCPAVYTCAGAWELRQSAPCAELAARKWHHLCVTLGAGGGLQLIVDGALVASSSSVPSSEGAAVAGAGAGACAEDPTGAPDVEVRGVRLHNALLPLDLINGCTGVKSPESHCFWTAREQIEGTPWFQRRKGWDHFILLGGHDYPSAFDPHRAPSDENYVLEQYWPDFRRLMVLHFGARTERCAAPWLMPSAGLNAGFTLAAEAPACAMRLLRTVTIPPALPGEPLRCTKTKYGMVPLPRRFRVAYRGLAYGAMVERALFARILDTPHFHRLQRAGWVKLEFTNWTYELLSSGICSVRSAFDGLCSWQSIGGNFSGIRDKRASRMKNRAQELWSNSAFCLVLPGDGGYERRLYSAIDNGCIPVIVNAPGVSFPKIPFARSLPWNEFAYFWSLDLSTFAISGTDEEALKEAWGRSVVQLMQALLAVSEEALNTKRDGLLRHMSGLSWFPQRGCRFGWPSPVRRAPSALTFLARELSELASLPDDVRYVAPEEWRRKDALHHVRDSESQDATGNGCPFGYFGCWLDDSDARGQSCISNVAGTSYKCPLACVHSEGGMRCAMRDDLTKPCQTEKCHTPVWMIDIANPSPVDIDGIEKQPPNDDPRYAIVSFSNRSALTDITWPTLQRFVEGHEGRYDLYLTREPLLDDRDYHPAWNKLAHMRKLLLVGHPHLQYKYEAVVWVDDDVAITNFSHDALHEAIQERLFCGGPCFRKLVLASRDEVTWERVPLNSGLLVMKRGEETLELIDELFKISHRRQLLGGVWRLPRTEGWWDQDAFAVYIRDKGDGPFSFVEHQQLQSLVRHTSSHWRPGDFSAHFTFLRALGTPEQQVAFVREGFRNMTALSADRALGAPLAAAAEAT